LTEGSVPETSFKDHTERIASGFASQGLGSGSTRPSTSSK